MKHVVSVCDFCQAQKKESNHWWRLEVVLFSGQPHLVVGPTDSSQLVNESVKDACGEQCVNVGVSQFLVYGKLT